MEKDNIRLEDAFLQLDNIIKELESKDISLDNSFKLYKEGMELLKYCNESIDLVEKRVQIINENGDLNEF